MIKPADLKGVAIEAKWQLKSLVKIWEERGEVHARWMYRCMKQLGYIPYEVHMHKTSWLLGACINMVKGSLANGEWMGLGLTMYRNETIEPGTIMVANPMLNIATFSEGGTVVKCVR